MNPAYEPLFTPFSIRSTRIKNRYFMAAMGTVTHNDEDGAYLPDAVDYFVRRAAGGVGLIITGANWVDNNIEVHSPGSFPCPTICPGKYIKAARVHSVNGQCRYGMDDRHLFHVDVQLPWRS